MKINKVSTGKYMFNHILKFTTDEGEEIELTPNVGLEIAYTLFDSYGMSYKSLEELEEKMEREE